VSSYETKQPIANKRGPAMLAANNPTLRQAALRQSQERGQTNETFGPKDFTMQ